MANPALVPSPTVLGISADVITSIATAFLAVATVTLAAATVAVAVIAARQLPLLADQIRIGGQQRIEDNTLAMIQHQNLNQIVVGASRRIWDSSESGTVYTNGLVDEHDVRIVANYLNVLAIGVKQKVYSGSLVKDHMEATFIKVVDVVIPAVFGNHDGYYWLKELRDSWKPRPEDPQHKSEAVQ